MCHWLQGQIHDILIIARRRTTVPRNECNYGRVVDWGQTVSEAFHQLWAEQNGQDVAEYAVMLAVILVIVIGTVRLIGGNANNVFSQVGSSLATQ